MRFGVALSMSLNLPFSQINAAALGSLGGTAGTIALALRAGPRLSWLVQWPHVRGWRFAVPEPSLICLADAQAVSDILALAYLHHSTERSGRARLFAANQSTAAIPQIAAAE